MGTLLVCPARTSDGWVVLVGMLVLLGTMAYY